MAAITAEIYRRPRWDPADALYRRCLTVCGVLGALFALAALLIPIQKRVIERVDQLPPRFARLVLEPPKPAAPGVAEAQSPLATFKAPPGGGGGGGGGDQGAAAKVIAPEPVAPAPAPAVRASRSGLAQGAGAA